MVAFDNIKKKSKWLFKVISQFKRQNNKQANKTYIVVLGYTRKISRILLTTFRNGPSQSLEYLEKREQMLNEKE